jgi:hypothetical protein
MNHKIRTNIIEPKARYESQKAIDELAKDLNLANDQWSQDWPYEVANQDDIEKYLNYYNTTEDEDKKFILMEMLIQSIEEQINEEKFLYYWNIVKHIIEADFLIHEYTIWYWCLFEDEYYENNMDDAWKIIPLMRELWYEIKNEDGIYDFNSALLLCAIIDTGGVSKGTDLKNIIEYTDRLNHPIMKFEEFNNDIKYLFRLGLVEEIDKIFFFFF